MALFRLPLPPSANQLVRPLFMGYANGKPQVRLVATGAAKAFRKIAHLTLPVAPIEGPVEFFATFYVPTISSDCSNRLKSLEDACKGRLIFDDVQVAEIHTRKVPTSDPEQVGVVFEVRPAVPGEHTELARRLATSTIAAQAAERAQAKLELGQNHDVIPAEKAPKNHTDLPESIRDRLNRLATPAEYRPTTPDDRETS